MVLISRGKVFTVSYFGRSTYILIPDSIISDSIISDILIYGGQCWSLSFKFEPEATCYNTHHAMAVGVFPHGDIVSVGIRIREPSYQYGFYIL